MIVMRMCSMMVMARVSMIVITGVTSRLNESICMYLSIIVKGKVFDLINSESQGLEKGHRFFTFDLLEHHSKFIIWQFVHEPAAELD